MRFISSLHNGFQKNKQTKKYDYFMGKWRLIQTVHMYDLGLIVASLF